MIEQFWKDSNIKSKSWGTWGFEYVLFGGDRNIKWKVYTCMVFDFFSPDSHKVKNKKLRIKQITEPLSLITVQAIKSS